MNNSNLNWIRPGLLTALGLALIAPTTRAQVNRPLFQHSRNLEAGSAQAILTRFVQRPTTRRVALARIDMSVFDRDRLTLNPFPELNLEATQSRVDFSGATHRAWFANLADDQGSAVFIINGSRISGKINSIHGTFEIFPLKNGECVVVEHIPGMFPGCGVDSRVSTQSSRTLDSSGTRPSVSLADAATELPAAEAPTGLGAAGDSPLENRIRVIVAYTEGAHLKTSLMFGRTMQEHIDLAIAESNQGYANSGVWFRLELACLYQTDSTETTAIEQDVEDFRNNGDGKFDEVHQLRADFDADMCCLLTDGRDYGWCGWSYGFDYTSRENMFQATSYNCATSNFSFVHEFGHTQGCRHNDDLMLTPFAYGHGFRNSTYWRTIMALANGTGAPRLNYWSNPRINSPVLPYTALGTPEDGTNFANDCTTALNTGGNTVINHETTPAISAEPTNCSFDNDEYADKAVTDSLTVEAFTAHPGSTIQFRAGKSILLGPGFQARTGSVFHAFLLNESGD